MKILYLDKELDVGRRKTRAASLTRRDAIRYRRFLRQRGHEVDVVQRVENLESLSKYDLGIVHPDIKDSAMLRDELTRRSDFRILLTTGTSHQYSEFSKFKHSNQVLAYSRIREEEWKEFEDELANLVEKGWAE